MTANTSDFMNKYIRDRVNGQPVAVEADGTPKPTRSNAGNGTATAPADQPPDMNALIRAEAGR